MEDFHLQSHQVNLYDSTAVEQEREYRIRSKQPHRPHKHRKLFTTIQQE